MERTVTDIAWEAPAVREALLNLEEPCHVTSQDGRIGVIRTKRPAEQGCVVAPVILPGQLGAGAFRERFRTRLAYMGGAMANGIASEEFVIVLRKAGILASFGAAGLSLPRIREAIRQIQKVQSDGPYAMNLIHTPDEPDREMAVVEECIKSGIAILEASAFLKLEPSIVRYRADGLFEDGRGTICANAHVVVKLSRREVAEQFLRPAPREMLRSLTAAGRLTPQRAALAERVPVASAITVEADSGGHTDRQPLVTLVPAMMRVRDKIQAQYGYAEPVLLGAAGGMGAPAALAAAFAMGADYVVTGSINQASLEAGTSLRVKEILASAESADVAMAPAADMFEMGVQVQVLKKGTMFPMRAQRLWEIYRQWDGLEALPATLRERLEKQYFRMGLDQVWELSQAHLAQSHPRLLAEARRSPKRRMATVFRWYLAHASKWAIAGDVERELDYQVWCGPAMGAFNTWTAGSSMAAPSGRGATRMAGALMRGAAFLTRLQFLRAAGLPVPAELFSVSPDELSESAPPVPVPTPISGVPVPGVIPSPEPSMKRSSREIAAFLSMQIAEHVAVSPQEIDTQASFESFGLDSVKGMVILGRLESWLDAKLSATLLWNYPTIELLAQRLVRTM